MSKSKDKTNFLQGISLSFLEEDDADGVEMAETRCLMNSNTDYGPNNVTQGMICRFRVEFASDPLSKLVTEPLSSLKLDTI